MPTKTLRYLERLKKIKKIQTESPSVQQQPSVPRPPLLIKYVRGLPSLWSRAQAFTDSTACVGRAERWHVHASTHALWHRVQPAGSTFVKQLFGPELVENCRLFSLAAQDWLMARFCVRKAASVKRSGSRVAPRQRLCVCVCVCEVHSGTSYWSHLQGQLGEVRSQHRVNGCVKSNPLVWTWKYSSLSLRLKKTSDLTWLLWICWIFPEYKQLLFF